MVSCRLAENHRHCFRGQHRRPAGPLHGLQPGQPLRDLLPPDRGSGKVVEERAEEWWPAKQINVSVVNLPYNCVSGPVR